MKKLYFLFILILPTILFSQEIDFDLKFGSSKGGSAYDKDSSRIVIKDGHIRFEELYFSGLLRIGSSRTHGYIDYSKTPTEDKGTWWEFRIDSTNKVAFYRKNGKVSQLLYVSSPYGPRYLENPISIDISGIYSQENLNLPFDRPYFLMDGISSKFAAHTKVRIGVQSKYHVTPFGYFTDQFNNRYVPGEWDSFESEDTINSSINELILSYHMYSNDSVLIKDTLKLQDNLMPLQNIKEKTINQNTEYIIGCWQNYEFYPDEIYSWTIYVHGYPKVKPEITGGEILSFENGIIKIKFFDEKQATLNIYGVDNTGHKSEIARQQFNIRDHQK